MTKAEFQKELNNLNASTVEEGLKRLEKIDVHTIEDKLLIYIVFSAWNELKKTFNLEIKPPEQFEEIMEKIRKEENEKL